MLKSIAQEPADRYGTAGELADDLERFLEDRPIHARHVGMVERLWRWSRRNRAVASMAALAAAMLVLVAVVASLGYVQTRAANRKVSEALAGESRQRKVAEAQQRKAEALSELTRAALDDIFEEFVPNTTMGSPQPPGFGSLDGDLRVPVPPVVSKDVAAMLERMLRYYERMAEQEGDDIQVRRKIADANRRVGDIRLRLGHFNQAETAYGRAVDFYQQADQESPDDLALATETAKVFNLLGNLHWLARSGEEGGPLHQKAMEILKSVGGIRRFPTGALRTGPDLLFPGPWRAA